MVSSLVEILVRVYLALDSTLTFIPHIRTSFSPNFRRPGQRATDKAAAGSAMTRWKRGQMGATLVIPTRLFKNASARRVFATPRRFASHCPILSPSQVPPQCPNPRAKNFEKSSKKAA